MISVECMNIYRCMAQHASLAIYHECLLYYIYIFVYYNICVSALEYCNGYSSDKCELLAYCSYTRRRIHHLRINPPNSYQNLSQQKSEIVSKAEFEDISLNANDYVGSITSRFILCDVDGIVV